LLVKNTRENLRLVEMLMEEFDKPILQVLIEARFITISQKDCLKSYQFLRKCSLTKPLKR